MSYKSSRKGRGCRAVGFVFRHVSLLLPPQQLDAKRLHAQVTRGSQWESKHTFLLVSRSLRLILPTPNHVTEIVSHERKGVEQLVYSALK